MGAEFLVGAVGQGLNSFMDSYLQAKDIERRKAESEDERAFRRRNAEREDFTAGVKYDPQTGKYSENQSSGLLSKPKERTLSRLIELRKASGEDWYRKDNDYARGLLDKLTRESFGGAADSPERGTDGTSFITPGSGGAPAPQPARPLSRGLLKPRAQARTEQIAQTEALGAIPSVPTGGTAQASPYAPIKQKIMGQHAADYGKYVPGYVSKAEKEQQKQNREKLFQIEMKEAEAAGGQKLPASNALTLSEAAAFPQMLSDLDKEVDAHVDIMGPVQGRIAGNNPYNKRAQVFNSKVTATAQRIGKYMEGGVLRAEDVPKYAKMLPQITDLPEVAKAKIKNVEDMIAKKQAADRQGLEAAGYRLGAAPAAPQQQAQSKPKTVMQNGHTYTLNESTGQYE